MARADGITSAIFLPCKRERNSLIDAEMHSGDRGALINPITIYQIDKPRKELSVKLNEKGQVERRIGWHHMCVKQHGIPIVGTSI